MEQYAAILRRIATFMELLPVKGLAAQANVKDVYRVSIQYNRIDTANSIITVISTGGDEVRVESVYQGYFDNKPIVRQMKMDTFREFALELRKIPFDRLQDQPNIAFYGEDLWLVERASAGFSKSVLLTPRSATHQHLLTYQILVKYLPETLREIK